MKQSRGTLFSQWFGPGGADYEEARRLLDFAVIMAGAGMTENELFQEHRQGCDAVGLPWFSCWIPDPMHDMDDQAMKYVDVVGQYGRRVCADLEPAAYGSLSRLVTGDQAELFMDLVDEYLYYSVPYTWAYSSPYYYRAMGEPPFVRYRHLYWAQYYYENWLLRKQYTRFEPWLQKYAGARPNSVGDDWKVVLWQISDQFDAQYYCAKPYYDGGPGIKEGTGEVSLIEHDEFMLLLGEGEDPEPEPPDDLTERVRVLELAFQTLDNSTNILNSNLMDLTDKHRELDERVKTFESVVYPMVEAIGGLSAKITALEEDSHTHDDVTESLR